MYFSLGLSLQLSLGTVLSYGESHRSAVKVKKIRDSPDAIQGRLWLVPLYLLRYQHLDVFDWAEQVTIFNSELMIVIKQNTEKLSEFCVMRTVSLTIFVANHRIRVV